MIKKVMSPYILIVDDNAAIKEALSWILEFEGYTVVTVNNGQDALSFIEKNEPPAIIVLDLMMPVMDGYEFREMYKQVPVLSVIPTVIISARRKTELTVKLRPNEIFLGKPFDFDLLLAFIKKNWLCSHSDVLEKEV